jgi:hypothetical protein
VGVVVGADPGLTVAMARTISFSSVAYSAGGMGVGHFAQAAAAGGAGGRHGLETGGVGSRIEPREALSLTVMINHDRVGGALAACFTRKLVHMSESG